MSIEKPKARPEPATPKPTSAPANAKMGRYYIFFGLVIAMAAVAAFFNTKLGAGEAHDRNVESDLRILTESINDYDLRYNRLPDNLSQVTGKQGRSNQLVDTLTSQAINQPLSDYAYKITGRFDYQICADFKTSTLNSQSANQAYTPKEQVHGAGHVCFDYTDDSAKVAAPVVSPPATASPSSKPTPSPIKR
jgi:hypothetical protein